MRRRLLHSKGTNLAIPVTQITGSGAARISLGNSKQEDEVWTQDEDEIARTKSTLK